MIAFIHTEVDERFEGMGLGGQLIASALHTTRPNGLAVLPFCPFVRGSIVKHPTYLDLVPAELSHQFDFPHDV